MKVLEASFVTSAADVAAVPRDSLPQIALVGRSNVGKSTLINALVGRKIAHTSATPGKTRLANLYRVHLQGGRPEASGALASWRMYLVDLPGYGYAHGAKTALEQFEVVTEAYFRGQRPEARGQGSARGPREALEGSAAGAAERERAEVGPREHQRKRTRGQRGSGFATAALLIVDARHPELEADRAAGRWLDELGLPYVVVATKVDKLSRNARASALRAIGQQHNSPALPVSAVAGEGLDLLWTQIVKLARR